MIAALYRKLYRHARRPGVHREHARGLLQSSAPVAEGAEIVAYTDDAGRWWFRPAAEFDDGRFSEIPRPPRRAVEVEIRVGGDDDDAAVRELDVVLQNAEREGLRDYVSGGAHGGHHVTVDRDSDVSPSDWRAAFRAWADGVHEARTPRDG